MSISSATPARGEGATGRSSTESSRVEPIRPGVATEVLAVVVALSGPVAMAAQGYVISLPTVLLGTSLLSLALAAAARRGRTASIVVLVGGTVLVAGVESFIAGYRSPLGPAIVLARGKAAIGVATLGLVCADWAVRRGALVRRSGPSPLAVPVLLATTAIVVVGRDAAPIPTVLVTAAVLVALAGWPATSLRAAALVTGGALVAALAPAAELATGWSVAAQWIFAAIVAHAVSEARRNGGPWSLLDRAGPLAFAAPALVVSMANVAAATMGWSTTGHLGYQAWLEGVERLPTRFTTVDGLFLVPTTILALLAVGAAWTAQHPSRWAIRTARFAGVTTAATIAIVLAWRLGLAI